MASYKKLKPIVLKWEGGYAGNIDGMTCTMKGVTLATFRKFFGKSKNCNDLRNISDAQWDTIFIQGFWNRWSGDAIKSQSIANLLVDWVWASGIYGIKLPQRVLGVKDDGVVGLIRQLLQLMITQIRRSYFRSFGIEEKSILNLLQLVIRKNS